MNPLDWWRQWQSGRAAPPATVDAAELRDADDPRAGDRTDFMVDDDVDEDAGDAVFGELLARVRAPLVAAARERGLVEPDAATLDRDATWLIDRIGEAPRILWVDDMPQGNRLERAALARLQIEVECVTGSDVALARLREATPPFDIVISDWRRDADGPDAGLTLALRMRAAGERQPIVYYHAGFDAALRAERRARALAAGAVGEAVLPQELIEMVVLALRGPR